MNMNFQHKNKLHSFFENHILTSSFLHRPITQDIEFKELQKRSDFLFLNRNCKVEVSSSGFNVCLPATTVVTEYKPDFLFLTIDQKENSFLFLLPTFPALGNEDAHIKFLNYKNLLILPSQNLLIRTHPAFEYDKSLSNPMWNQWIKLNSKLLQQEQPAQRIRAGENRYSSQNMESYGI